MFYHVDRVMSTFWGFTGSEGNLGIEIGSIVYSNVRDGK